MKQTQAFLAILAVLLTAAGCSNEKPTMPNGADQTAFADPRMDIPIEDAGQFHNDLVLAFHDRWGARGQPRTPGQVLLSMTEAANEVLPAYGAPAILTESDLVYVVAMVLEIWRLAGFKPGDEDADPQRIIRVLLESGLISRPESDFAHRYVAALSKEDVTPSALRALEDEPIATESENVRYFLDVTQASGELWSDLIPEPDTSSVIGDWGEKVVDGLAMLGKLRPILRVVGAATASEMFSYLFDSGFFEGYSRYNPCRPCWAVSR